MNEIIYPTLGIYCNLMESIKISLNKKSLSDISNLHCVQHFIHEKKNSAEYLNKFKKKKQGKKNLTENCVWVIKFSPEGKWMATGGSDAILRIYEVNDNPDSCKVIQNN